MLKTCLIICLQAFLNLGTIQDIYRIEYHQKTGGEVGYYISEIKQEAYELCYSDLMKVISSNNSYKLIAYEVDEDYFPTLFIVTDRCYIFIDLYADKNQIHIIMQNKTYVRTFKRYILRTLIEYYGD